MSLDILSLGTSNMDFILKVPDFVEPDGEMYIENMYITPGGSALNFAVDISQYGLNSGLISWIGNDNWGNTIENNLFQRGINVHCLRKTQYPTGMAFISVDDSGKRSIYSFMGANEKLNLNGEDIRHIKSAKMLHLTGIYWEVAQEAAKHAKSLSFAPGSLLSTYGIDKLKPVLENTDILFLNENEVEIFTGLDLNEGAELLLAEGASIVVITLGKKGAVLYTEKKEIFSPSNKINVLDTTGAGDAFAAGFVSQWLKNKPLEYCLKFANNAAEECIVNLGAIY